MLVLSRKLGERIVVPQCGLAVTIIAVQGKTVQVRIDAPAEVAVLREEVVRRKKAVGTTSLKNGSKPP